jgi:hypothetical protein
LGTRPQTPATAAGNCEAKPPRARPVAPGPWTGRDRTGPARDRRGLAAASSAHQVHDCAGARGPMNTGRNAKRTWAVNPMAPAVLNNEAAYSLGLIPRSQDMSSSAPVRKANASSPIESRRPDPAFGAKRPRTQRAKVSAKYSVAGFSMGQSTRREPLRFVVELGTPTHPGSPAWLVTVGESIEDSCLPTTMVLDCGHGQTCGCDPAGG